MLKDSFFAIFFPSSKIIVNKYAIIKKIAKLIEINYNKKTNFTKESDNMNDTICAISTNTGNNGAISIVRISGPEAIAITSKIFTNLKFATAESHTIHYGYIKWKEEPVDEVLVMKMLAPKTYTTEDIVEINCHGGMISTQKILEILILNGARIAEPGEFTKRAFLNGRINLLEAEAVSDMIEAKTDHARSLAMNGISGKITKLIQNLREEIVNILTNIEVNIDYPEYEDELVITHENILPRIKNITKKLEKIIEESQNGKIIKEGINIAFIGRPNVGKSSLLNAFLEEEKAIVTDVSGTTRDIVEGSISLNGILVNLIDTAGIRDTEDIVEKIGVQKSKEMLETADIIILVLNYNEPLQKEDYELLEIINSKPHIIFLNKNDLPKKINCDKILSNAVLGNTIELTGLDKLKDEIKNRFHLNEFETKDFTYLSNIRQLTLAKQALQNLKSVEVQININTPIDLLEMDLKTAWNQLGLIIGESYEEELVDNLFQKFCLGK